MMLFTLLSLFYSGDRTYFPFAKAVWQVAVLNLAGLSEVPRTPNEREGHAESPLTESDIIALFPKPIALYLPHDKLYAFPQDLGLKICLFGVG